MAIKMSETVDEVQAAVMKKGVQGSGGLSQRGGAMRAFSRPLHA